MDVMNLVKMICGALPMAAALTLAPPAQADPACAAFGTCQYMPNPWYDGPLMPTWDTPGYYGGWTTGPVVCDPHSYACRGVAPVP